MTRLSGWLLRHKLAVLLVWFIVLAVGVVLTPTVNQRMSADFSLPGQPGYQANLAIAETYGLVFPGDHADDPTAAAEALRAALPPGATVHVTGIDQLSSHGSGGSPGGEVVNLTLIGASGALAVLAFVFGSLLALAPLLVAAVAILATLLLVGLLTVVTEVNLIVEYLVALIGLGVAIDYSLLLVTRWREERANGHQGGEAVHRALATVVRSVLVPALVSLLGRWNWWLPAWAARLLRVTPSGAPAEPATSDQPSHAAPEPRPG